MNEMGKEFIFGVTRIISEPIKIKNLLIDLIQSATSEILLILPTSNAFLRKNRIGVMQILKTMTEVNPKLLVRILTPTNNFVDKIIKTVLINNYDGNGTKY